MLPAHSAGETAAHKLHPEVWGGLGGWAVGWGVRTVHPKLVRRRSGGWGGGSAPEPARRVQRLRGRGGGLLRREHRAHRRRPLQDGVRPSSRPPGMYPLENAHIIKGERVRGPQAARPHAGRRWPPRRCTGAQVAAGGLLVPGGVCGRSRASAPPYGTISGLGNRLLDDVGAGGAACAPAQGRRRRGRARSRRSRRSTPACTGAEHRSRGFRGAGRGVRLAAIERWHARARAGKGGADPARVRGVLRHGSVASKDGRRPIFWRRGRGRGHGLPCRESNLVVTHLSCLKGGETSNGPLRARQPCPASGAGLTAAQCSVL